MGMKDEMQQKAQQAREKAQQAKQQAQERGRQAQDKLRGQQGQEQQGRRSSVDDIQDDDLGDLS